MKANRRLYDLVQIMCEGHCTLRRLAERLGVSTPIGAI